MESKQGRDCIPKNVMRCGYYFSGNTRIQYLDSIGARRNRLGTDK